jgi:hypothetical protein
MQHRYLLPIQNQYIMSNNNPLYEMDGLGNLINKITGQIDGYYDSITEKCYHLSDGTELICPPINPNLNQATATGNQTFFWVAAIGLGLWWLNRRSE